MISYTQKSFLVVDDFTEFRNSVKAMLRQIGAVNVDVGTSGEEAIAMCRKKKYDIILHDYNLGPGKNGQQVLEELTLQKLLSPHTIFIMVTAENSLAMVMSAVEYEPDDYLTKPFNRAALLQRLDKLVERREAMASINDAAAREAWQEMVHACDQVIATHRKYAAMAVRKKALALSNMGNNKDLESLLRDVVSQRPVPWALIMLGRHMLRKGDASGVELMMQDAIRQFPQLPALYDVLAEAQLMLEQKELAQQTIQEALKTSPRSLSRQMKLGDLARTNGDLDTAVKAFRESVDLGRGSCLKSPDNYIKFVSVVNEHASKEGTSLDRRYQEETLKVLSELNKDYSDDKAVMARSYLAQAVTLKNSGKEKEAQQWAKKASDSIASLPHFFSADAAIDVIEQLKDVGQGETAQKLLHTCAEMYGDDPKILQTLTDQGGAAELMARVAQARQLNKAAAALYEKRQFVEAVKSFQEASDLQPRNITIVLNAVQNLIQASKIKPEEAEAYKLQAAQLLNNLKEMSPNDPRYDRMQKLRRLISK